MDIPAHQLVATGVALVGAGAIALTPVGPSLHSLILRSQTVPPIAAAELPGWMTQGAADLAERIAEASGLPPAAVLSVPKPVTGHAIIAGAELGGTAVETPPAVVSNLTPDLTPVSIGGDLLHAVIDNPIPVTFEGLTSLVTNAVAPVVGVVRDIAVGSVEEVGRVLRALADVAMPIVAAILHLPVAIGNFIVDAITALVDRWTELRGGPSTSAPVAQRVSPAPVVPTTARMSTALGPGGDTEYADSARVVAPTPVRSAKTSAPPGDRDGPSTTRRGVKRVAVADHGSTDGRTARPPKKPPSTSTEAE